MKNGLLIFSMMLYCLMFYRRSNALTLLNEKEFRGLTLVIDRKKEHGNKISQKIQRGNSTVSSSKSKAASDRNTSKDTSEQASGTATIDFSGTINNLITGISQGVRSKKQSSSTRQQQQSEKSANKVGVENKDSDRSSRQSNVTRSQPPVALKSTTRENEETAAVSSDKQEKRRKTRRKTRKQGSEPVTDGQPSVEANTSTNMRETSAQASVGAIIVPPSSMVTPDVMMRKRETGPSSSVKKIQVEPLNFRGGFTPSGRSRENKISESSDSSVQPESAAQSIRPALHLGQMPQQPVVNDLAGRGKQQLQPNGAHSQQNYSRRRQGPPSVPYNGQTPIPRPVSNMNHTQPSHYQQQNYILSPTFSSQVPVQVVGFLADPRKSMQLGSPYKYGYSSPAMSVYPHFLELFQKLPDESYKPQKDNLFKQFQGLHLSEQLEQFYLAQTLPFEEVRLRWQILTDVMFILRQHFPNCEVFAFGSILTGLGDYMSDVDIYIDLLGESTARQPIDKKIDSHEAVDIVKRIMKKSSCPHTNRSFVRNLIPVKSARVPILKITHTTTKINCDLSFENRLSVQNTKMILFYLNLDVRIYRFMVLIRFWAKFHNLTGSNHIKNYALTLMVLVYLTRKGYVPSVEFLQRLKADERKRQRITRNFDEIDGWDASFCDNVSVIKQHFKAVNLPSINNNSNQSQTLIQMSLEFFEMFSKLDLSKFVVCPLLGDFIPRTKFQPGSEEILPDTLDRYKNWAVNQQINRRLNLKTHLCVQDPFVLSFNVGSVTPLGTLLRFQIACARSLEILRQNNGLNSLLDVLERLPSHIGDKKFMKAYKTEMKGQEIRKEIKLNALGITEKEPTPSSYNRQISSYVKLPAHLKSYDRLIDEKSLKQTVKRPRWEIYLDFSLGSQFEDTYVAELTRCKILQNVKRVTLMDNLCTLWHDFTIDFVKHFFETGLKLTVVDKKGKSLEPEACTDTDPIDGEEVQSVDDTNGKRKSWKVKLFNKQEEELVLQQATLLGFKSSDDVEKLSKKISELGSIPGVIEYSAVTYLVDYPFWDKRPTEQEKVSKKIKLDEMFRIPVLPTPRQIKKDKSKNKDKRSVRKGKNEESDFKNSSKQTWNCFNPINLESMASERVVKNQKEQNDFTPFRFHLLTKLDLSTISDRPQIFFIFEKVKKKIQTSKRILKNLYDIGSKNNSLFD